MSNALPEHRSARERPHPSAARRISAKTAYFALLRERDDQPGQIYELARAASRSFLHDRLAAAALLTSDLPDNPRSLKTWMEDSSRQAAQAYQMYLAGRSAGASRRYFRNRSHAFHFLRSVAPTKLVDGAWLFGLLRNWPDPRFASLIRIYLEELGEGCADRNHVLVYRRLLEQHGCDAWSDLDEGYFTQGAIQLALAHNAGEFLPEVIGFNLGYEQLPLHLLITAYELAELDIDPYYFTLHVTVDNASIGHARKSIEAVLENAPRLGDAREFYRRVVSGYKLNSLGIGTCEAIDAFVLDQALISMLQRKAPVGLVHSDYCRFQGRTVNEWLAESESMPAFVAALEKAGWIKRHQDPRRSRFWQVIDGERAPMSGVFNAYERQLIYDWIKGDANDVEGDSAVAAGATPSRPARRAGVRFRAVPKDPDRAAKVTSHSVGRETVADVVARMFDEADSGAEAGMSDEDIGALRGSVFAASSKEQAMSRLIGLMSPSTHHFPVGLLATRIYAALLAHRA